MLGARVVSAVSRRQFAENGGSYWPYWACAAEVGPEWTLGAVTCGGPDDRFGVGRIGVTVSGVVAVAPAPIAARGGAIGRITCRRGTPGACVEWAPAAIGDECVGRTIRYTDAAAPAAIKPTPAASAACAGGTASAERTAAPRRAGAGGAGAVGGTTSIAGSTAGTGTCGSPTPAVAARRAQATVSNASPWFGTKTRKRPS